MSHFSPLLIITLFLVLSVIYTVSDIKSINKLFQSVLVFLYFLIFSFISNIHNTAFWFRSYLYWFWNIQHHSQFGAFIVKIIFTYLIFFHCYSYIFRNFWRGLCIWKRNIVNNGNLVTLSAKLINFLLHLFKSACIIIQNVEHQSWNVMKRKYATYGLWQVCMY